MNGIFGDALKIAMQLFHEEYGGDAKLEDGDEFVTCFANGSIIISLDDGELQVKAVGGKAFYSDYKIPIYEEADHGTD